MEQIKRGEWKYEAFIYIFAVNKLVQGYNCLQASAVNKIFSNFYQKH